MVAGGQKKKISLGRQHDTWSKDPIIFLPNKTIFPVKE
jgi:hypothetical protein